MTLNILDRMACGLTLALLSMVLLPACGEELDPVAHVSIMNDFNNAELAFQPPWTICESSYLGVEFGTIAIGETSAQHDVTPGYDFVLMVAAWDDPECSPEHTVPIASKEEEEVVDGQQRVIAINLPNHQGPCPPEGVAPIPSEQYERIRQLWPEYAFPAYEQRGELQQCQE